MSLGPTPLDGRVELRELVGEGGMGEVHAGWDRALQRPVAVKFVRGSDPRAAERLLLEARLQARVEHPHVVKVFEVGVLDGRPCILFQLVRGEPLADIAPSLPVEQRVELLRQAATGLHAAHLQGLVHRDVKPGNILVEEAEDGSRSALVTDFGLAHAEEGGLTRSGVLPGTLDFMAPEQLAGGGPVDFRSDVYALGATLYAVLAGRPPFRIPSAKPESSGEEQLKLLHRILDEEAPLLSSVAPGVPKELALVARKAMEREPGARYASAEAFALDLSRFLRGEPVQARPATLLERSSKWARRNPTASRAVGAALAVLLLAGGFTAWLSRQASRDALEAARLGALAASLESRMRMEYLSPPHELRPALAAVKTQVEQLRPLSRRRGGGPASFALGKGLELLGDLDGARAAYERAWSLGFRTPQAAQGLGLTLGRTYARERRLAAQSLAPEARDRRLAALRAELLVPAHQVLEAVERQGAHGAWIDASVAEAEGDTERARARAREALAEDPSLYEARLLEGRAFVQEAMDRIDESRLADADAALVRAIPVLEEALRAGRSDPGVLRALADAHYRRAVVADRRGTDAAPPSEQALAWLDRLHDLDPDDAGLFQLRGLIRTTWGLNAAMTGKGDATGLMQAAAQDLRRARELRPGEAETADKLLYALFNAAFLKHQRGLPAGEEVEEGVRVYRAAVEAAPARASIHYDGLLVLMERAREHERERTGTPKDFEEAQEAGEEALRLLPRRPAVVLEGLVTVGISLAKARWEAGQDPRPDLRRALERAGELLREAPALASLTRNAWALGEVGYLDLAMGEDFADVTARALDIAERAHRQKPDHPHVKVLRGEVSLLEARRLLSSGADPAAVLRDADRWIVEGSRALGDRAAVRDDLAELALQRGCQEALLGRDPAVSLARAEKQFLAILQGDQGNRDALAGLAWVALQRSGWARRRGRSGEAEARAGLAQAGPAAAGRDPELRVLVARLQGLAGDREASRASLDGAYALQPLVRGHREARAAEAELAASGREGTHP